MRKLGAMAGCLALAACNAQAPTPAPEPAPASAPAGYVLPNSTTAEIKAVDYVCDGKQPLHVEFVNAEPNHLAIMTLGDQTLVFANVLSGSGARYVATVYEFWSKGDTATLRNLTEDDPGHNCVVGKAPAAAP